MGGDERRLIDQRVSELRHEAESKGWQFLILRRSRKDVVYQTRSPGGAWCRFNLSAEGIRDLSAGDSDEVESAVQCFPTAVETVSVTGGPEAELPPIPGLDPIADKLRELSSHFAAAGSTFEILEQSITSAEVRVSQKFMGSRSRRYRLTRIQGRQVQTEPRD